MKRPFRVILFAVAVLSLALFNAGRVIQAIHDANLFLNYNLQAALAANFFTGAFWAIGFGAAAIGLWRLRRWARTWMLIAIVVYLANLWIVRLAFARSSDEPSTRPADAALSILSIVIVWAFLFWPRVRKAFG